MDTKKVDQNHLADHRLIQRENKYYAKASRMDYFDLVIDHAHDATLVDVDGNEYIDVLASASAVNVGHTNEKVVKAIQDQAEKLVHYTPGYFHHQPEQQLAERLAKLVPGEPKQVTFGNSGSDANDAIIKFSRAYTKRPYIVSFMDSYHGSTYGSMTLSGVSLNMTRNMGPMLPDVVHVPYPDLYRTEPGESEHDVSLRYFDEFKKPFETFLPVEEVACVLIEPIQGDGGIRKAPEEYMQLLYKFCHDNGILFAVDEVNQGIGRTGKMWSIQQFKDIEPDLMSVGKSLASGMPLSAVIGKKKVMESLDSPAHVFTTSGNPVCCAAALATLDVLDEKDLLEKSVEDGKYVEEQFLKLKDKYEEIGDVRFYGLDGGIELVTDKKSKTPNPDFANKVIYYAFEHGVVIITLKNNILRFQPPLVITREQLDKVLNVLEKAIVAAENDEVDVPDEDSMGW
ncbi:aspartate aminotransferase family protein [Companilactobacillus allii]|uniref:Aspartate aminotransferase family protein n=1 Tax=Companilactobacillus allii TaxID=1847728 RepID=A0A1P8Q264_9LACO|nr:aspartate aminotransferase family protein [Companilactobacillus allii]APX71907.1 aspartate aminotransferase family protein [Companilactobacillus allii]USQ69000.1 aspartate aminotransferase family protein [Companilactobacillus allii]